MDTDGDGIGITRTMMTTMTAFQIHLIQSLYGGNQPPELIGRFDPVDVEENSRIVHDFDAIDAEGDPFGFYLTGDDAALFSIDDEGLLTFNVGAQTR